MSQTSDLLPLNPKNKSKFNGFRIHLVGNDFPSGTVAAGDKSYATAYCRLGLAFPEDNGDISSRSFGSILAPSSSVGSTHRDSDKNDPSCNDCRHFPKLDHRLVPEPELPSSNKSPALLHKELPARIFWCSSTIPFLSRSSESGINRLGFLRS